MTCGDSFTGHHGRACPVGHRSPTWADKAHARQIAGLDPDLDQAIRRRPVWRAQENLLRSVPGVGPIVARTLLA